MKFATRAVNVVTTSPRNRGLDAVETPLARAHVDADKHFSTDFGTVFILVCCCCHCFCKALKPATQEPNYILTTSRKTCQRSDIRIHISYAPSAAAPRTSLRKNPRLRPPGPATYTVGYTA